jgi:KipI family sensor histidine kinase inhibitor
MSDHPSRWLHPYGEAAVLLECADLADTQAVRAELQRDLWPEIAEVITGAQTLLLRLRGPLSHRRVQQLERLSPAAASEEAAADPIRIEVDYSGEDLAEVAELVGLSSDEVVAEHTGQLWTVAFCGFAPGFAYLYCESDRLRVPRRDTPRKQVPAGAVGLADRWSAVYPRSSPGGWQLIGRASMPMWDLQRDPPAVLQPGARVQFVSAVSGPSTNSGGER